MVVLKLQRFSNFDNQIIFKKVSHQDGKKIDLVLIINLKNKPKRNTPWNFEIQERKEPLNNQDLQ